jgi:hypothetical protein
VRLAVELIGDGRQQPVLRGDGCRAGVEQREAAGAVGRFHHARREARLPDGRGLLVAGHAADRNPAPEQSGVGRAEIAAQSRTSGSIAAAREGAGRSSSSQLAGVDVVEQRARGVGGVGGMHLAAGQPPEQEAVDGAEGEFAPFGAGAGALHLVEQPGDLGAGEIGIEQQARSFS